MPKIQTRTKEKQLNSVVISTRDFIRNFSTVSRQQKYYQYIVMRHGKVVGRFTPSSEDDLWLKNINQTDYPEAQLKVENKKRVTLEDLRKLSFRSGENNLSQRIDEIVYGIKP